MARIVIPGGTGYLGSALTEKLVARGDEVVVLSRNPGSSRKGVRVVSWDARTLGDWVNELDGSAAIVHLSGRRVDVRATKRNIDELISSRVESVRVVGEAWCLCKAPPPIWLQSASLAIFGNGGSATIDESTTPSGIGPREMVTVCLAWEAAFRQASALVPRSVLLRMGIGLGGVGDPATAKLAKLVRLGLGGRVGSGRQWVSWTGLEDLVSVMLRILDDSSMVGTYHATSPNPVTNSEMMAVYRRLLGRNFGLPAPALLARLGAPLLGSSGSLALVGRRVVPTRLLEGGFAFAQSDFERTARWALDRAGLI